MIDPSFLMGSQRGCQGDVVVCDPLPGLHEAAGMVPDCCGGGPDLARPRNPVHRAGARSEVLELGEERGEKTEAGLVPWEPALWVDVVLHFRFHDHAHEELFPGPPEVGFVQCGVELQVVHSVEYAVLKRKARVLMCVRPALFCVLVLFPG